MNGQRNQRKPKITSAIEKQGVTKQDFLELHSKLFCTKGGYFSIDPTNENGNRQSKCVRVLWVFLQLTKRDFLNEVMGKPYIDDLVEHNYDALEVNQGAKGAKKAFHLVVWNK